MLRALPCHLRCKVAGACVAQVQKQSEERRCVPEGSCHVKVRGAGETALGSRRVLLESGARNYWALHLAIQHR